MFKIIPTAGAAVSVNLFAGVVLLASPGMAAADDINPFDNTQPSLVITEAVEFEGTFPDPVVAPLPPLPVARRIRL